MVLLFCYLRTLLCASIALGSEKVVGPHGDLDEPFDAIVVDQSAESCTENEADDGPEEAACAVVDQLTPPTFETNSLVIPPDEQSDDGIQCDADGDLIPRHIH